MGNDTPLANPDVAPSAGASASTWGGLAGTWASDLTYWTSLSSIYESMGAHAGPAFGKLEPLASSTPTGCPVGTPAISGDYALPIERRWYDEHPGGFPRPHPDSPAVPLPVPARTPPFPLTHGPRPDERLGGTAGVS